MDDLFNSPLMTDLKAGKLPPMTINFDLVTIATLCAGLFVTGLLLIKISKL